MTASPLETLAGTLGTAVEDLGAVVQKTGAAASATVSGVADTAAGVTGALGGALTAPTIKVSSPEPGSRTSELKLAVAALAGIGAVFGVSINQGTQAAIVGIATGAIAVVSGVYTLARTWRKNSHGKNA